MPPSAPAPAPPAAVVNAEDDGTADDDGMDGILSQNFAKELAQGMEALMKELGAEGGMAAQPTGNEQVNEEELMKQFEAMMAGFGGGGGGTTSAAAAPAATTKSREAAPSASTSGAKPQAANFNEAIAATLAKLKESDATATATNSSAADNPFAALGGGDGDDMAKLLAALGGAGGADGADGGLDNPELAKMLEGMMDELMSRDILYEPLKELRDKYPAYLNGPESHNISAEDRKRYEEQSRCIQQIVTLFDDPKYDAKNKQMTQKIQDLMNHMQDCGSPPQEIVGDMPAELENIPGFGGGAGGEECIVM